MLNVKSKWCKKNELTVNRSKNKMIIFTRKKDMSGLKIAMIDGINIHLVSQVKYLGVLADNKVD